MAEFEEKLSSILGNQEAMDQIMALAHSLSGEAGERKAAAPEEHAPPSEKEGTISDSSDLTQLLSGVDPGMIEMGMRLFREYGGEDDRNAALLRALRPFLREERRAKLDKAVRIARMTRLVRAALGSLGEKGDEQGV